MNHPSVTDSSFAWVFMVLFGLLLAVRLYYRLKTGDLWRPLVNQSEGLGNILFRWVAGALLFASLLGYFLTPQAVGWIFLPVPLPARVVGVVMAALAIALIWWSHRALQDAFSSTLRTTARQKLVTTGPYRWVAHPMYSGYFLLFFGALLFTRSWLVGGLGMTIIGSLMTTRRAREERMLIEHFGSDYQDYLRRTGRFLPLLGSRSSAPSDSRAKDPTVSG